MKATLWQIRRIGMQSSQKLHPDGTTHKQEEISQPQRSLHRSKGCKSHIRPPSLRTYIGKMNSHDVWFLKISEIFQVSLRAVRLCSWTACTQTCSLWSPAQKQQLKKKLDDLRRGLPRWLSGREPACQCSRHRRCRFDTWIGKIP